jgi:hypothetical protein
MPTPNIFCMVVEQVLSASPLVPNKSRPCSQQKMQLEKMQLEEKQETLEKMNPLNVHCPSNTRCGYVPKPRRRRRKSECDYDY